MANSISNKTNETVTKMVTRWINELQSSVDAQYTPRPETTLNSKYGIYPEEFILQTPKIMYFGLGLYGCYNVDDKNLSAPFVASPDELDLYSPIPLRCVPIDEDLSAAERRSYRIRKRMDYNGQSYFCYYLKALTIPQNTVQLTRTNPISKEEEPWELNSSQLNPVPIIPTTSGEQSGTNTEINASIKVNASWVGREVLEAINVIYNGDMRRATISEIGIYSGEDRELTGYNANGQEIRYTESIYTQIAYKICNTGTAITSPTYDGSRSFALTNSSIIVL